VRHDDVATFAQQAQAVVGRAVQATGELRGDAAGNSSVAQTRWSTPVGASRPPTCQAVGSGQWPSEACSAQRVTDTV
jgi:hypothetical protein